MEPELFSHEISFRDRERNMKAVHKFIHEAVIQTIHDLFFLSDILQDPLLKNSNSKRRKSSKSSRSSRSSKSSKASTTKTKETTTSERPQPLDDLFFQRDDDDDDRASINSFQSHNPNEDDEADDGVSERSIPPGHLNYFKYDTTKFPPSSSASNKLPFSKSFAFNRDKLYHDPVPEEEDLDLEPEQQPLDDDYTPRFPPKMSRKEPQLEEEEADDESIVSQSSRGSERSNSSDSEHRERWIKRLKWNE